MKLKTNLPVSNDSKTQNCCTAVNFLYAFHGLSVATPLYSAYLQY